MSEHSGQSGLSSPAPRGQTQDYSVDRLARTRVEIQNGEIQLDAQIIADGFDLEPARIPALMRDGAITSLCECGVDEDAGRYRLTFFHKSRRFRLVFDNTGSLIQRGIIDFGSRPLPAAMHNPST
jgi:hypothetical protein